MQKRVFSLVLLNAYTEALQLSASEPGEPEMPGIPKSQADCETGVYSPNPGSYHYEFLQSACLCQFKIESMNFTPQILCPTVEDPEINPAFYFGGMEPLCVEKAQAEAILLFDPGYGPDCIPGNADDDLNNVGDDDCPANYFYNFDFCGCTVNDISQLDMNCQTLHETGCNGDEVLHPLTQCSCITLEQQAALSLQAMGLGYDCIAGTEDDPVNPAPCENDTFGWMYSQELCQCTAPYTCADFNEDCAASGNVLDPISKCSCISQEQNDAIIAAADALGPDCIAGNADDDSDNVGDDDCPEGYHYHYEYCGCTADLPSNLAPECTDLLLIGCEDQFLHPLTQCSCVTQEELDALLLEAQALGPDCIAGTQDDPVNEEPCQNDPYGWIWQPGYCQCAAQFTCSEFTEECGPGTILDPIGKCSCISYEALDTLVAAAQALGEDCILGTPDDDENNVGDDDCPAGFSYDFEYCGCVADILDSLSPECQETAQAGCTEGVLHPISQCECISLDQQAALLLEAQGLGADCIAMTADDPINESPCESEPWGFAYEQGLCQCAAQLQCSSLTEDCGEGMTLDPIGKCSCIPQSEADSILAAAQALGEDCILGTPDDDENNVGDDDCPAGFSYDFEYCGCVADAASSLSPECQAIQQEGCIEGVLHPITQCSCITEAQQQALLLIAQGLGEDCIAGTTDDLVNEEPCTSYPYGWIYQPSICQCSAQFTCPQIVHECSDGTILDPIGKCSCISQDQFDEIYKFAAALGEDCILGTPDDDDNNVGDDDCPATHSYNFEYCGCVANDYAGLSLDCQLVKQAGCDVGILHPISQCECISLDQQAALLLEAQGLGADCIAMTADDPINESPCESEPWGFAYEQGLCQCAAQLQCSALTEDCGEGMALDPIGKCSCIPQSEADSILAAAQALGVDCILGTPDDDENNVGDDDCPAGFSYDFEYCGCVADMLDSLSPECQETAQAGCTEGVLHPISQCECISLDQQAALLLEAQGLGADCIAMTADDPINESPCESEPWGFAYEQGLCQCAAQLQCSSLTEDCGEGMTLDPIGKCSCIPQSEADSILAAAQVLGEDCILGTPDDDENNVGDDDCPAGFSYDFEYCGCVADAASSLSPECQAIQQEGCIEGVLHPITQCSCITEEQQAVLRLEAQGLGQDCIALTLDDPINVAPCEQSPWGYVYDESICSCASQYQCSNLSENCGDLGLILDPISKCSCITYDEFDSIYASAAALGEDCILGTSDDDENNVGDDDCPAGFSYNFEYCGCVAQEVSSLSPECQAIEALGCEEGLIHPLTRCSCITEDQQSALLIEAQALGDDCIAGTLDDPINAEPCTQSPYGWVYRQDICQCGAQVQCTSLSEDCAESGLFLDPITLCSCLSPEEYNNIINYVDLLGEDCIVGTPDDDDNDVGDDDCPAGTEYNYDYCGCEVVDFLAQSLECQQLMYEGCGDDVLHPLSMCSCISQQENAALLLQAQGLGADCIAMTEDDPVNEAPCEAEPWGYVYDQSICQCAAQYQCTGFSEVCEEGTVLDPIGKCSCIPQGELNSILAAAAEALGADCILGTFDDDENDVGDDDCPQGFSYNYEFCGCVAQDYTYLEPYCQGMVQGGCGEDALLHPINQCSCISFEEHQSLLLQVQSLGDDCIAGTEDDPINASPCEGSPFGWEFDSSVCQCTAPAYTCAQILGSIDNACEAPLQLHPVNKCECIDQASYDQILAESAALGPDCIADSGDEPIEDKNEDQEEDCLEEEEAYVYKITQVIANQEIDRVYSQEQCPEGATFNKHACACFYDDFCPELDCQSTNESIIVRNPIEFCGCIAESDFFAIFDHGLGSDCRLVQETPQSNCNCSNCSGYDCSCDCH